MLIKINSKDVKGLLSSGISPRTLEVIENAKKTGSVFRSKRDLLNIGLPEAEIELMSGFVSFGDPPPEHDYKFATIVTEPGDLPEYTLFVGYTNKHSQETIEGIYLIGQGGSTEIRYDELVASDEFSLHVKAPNGAIVETELNGRLALFHDVGKEALNETHLKITPYQAAQTSPATVGKPTRIKGRLISSNPVRNMEKIQLVFFVSINGGMGGALSFYPVCTAETETNGYFFSSPLNFRSSTDYNHLAQAKAKIAIEGNPEIAIRLEPGALPIDGGQPGGGQLPERVILYLEEGSEGADSKAGDCGCKDLDFHERKVLDEFSYYTVVRTTEPLIRANEISDVEEVNLEDLLDGIIVDPVLRGKLIGIKAPKAMLRAFIDRNGAITDENANKLIQETQHYAIKTKLDQGNKAFQGRLSLDVDVAVNWDDKPTVFEAVTIAHGHLLNFKQEWYSDGYSLGDLLYSLPLAPGQKKQIVVFDWDRKDSAANTQQLDYQESLYNSLSRDRDVNEVANASLSEKSFGGSLAAAGGRAGGAGGIVSGLIMGVAGGFGFGGSIAGQTSRRSTTASSQQTIQDRTVQAASSVRSQRSTVIQTVSQGERFQVSAEVVANYNHCHAMTVQYFEVLRHFEIVTRLANVQECLFIPLRLSPFDRKKALRWRDILSAVLKKRSLVKGFSAIERIEEEMESAAQNYYDKIGYPKNNYAEKPLNYIEGEIYVEFQLERPADKIDESGVHYVAQNWAPFLGFIGQSLEEFYERYIKNQQLKDDYFIKHAGPSIARNVINSLGFYAVKRGQSAVKLPVDATLLSNFDNRRQLNITLRMEGDFASDIKREDIDFVEIRIEGDSSWIDRICNMMLAGVRMIVHSGSMKYRTQIANDFLFRNAIIKNDLTVGGDNVRIHTPLNAAELRNPRNEDVEACNALLHHLNENLEQYHQAVWYQLDEQRRFMLLDGVVAPGKANGRSVASVVENRLIGIVGNCLVMPVAPGLQLDPILDDKVDLFQHYYEDPLDPVRLSLPTKGVFAEAVMGQCNSCEKKDETRFWRWEESPIPDSPTAINPIATPVPQNVQPDLQAKDFPTPIINVQAPPSLPDPQGYGSLIQLLSNPNLFRDITGLTENQKNALAAFQASLTSAQGFASMAKELEIQKLNQQHSDKMLDDIRNAPELTNQEKAALIKDHLQQRIDGGASKAAEQAAAARNAKTSLSDVAARAEEKGKPVKASTIDPAGKSESVEIGGGAAEGPVLAEVSGKLPRLQQENDNACWATAATIMVAWKRKDSSLTVEQVLAIAGDEYVQKFRNGENLPASQKDAFIAKLDMKAEAPASYPLQQYINWIRRFGPLWVTTDAADGAQAFSPHARILFKITGTASEDGTGTYFHFLDTSTGAEASEPFTVFLEKYEAMATDNPSPDLFTQIVHFKDEIIGEGRAAGDHFVRLTYNKQWRANNVAKEALGRLAHYRSSISASAWQINQTDLFNRLEELILEPSKMYQGSIGYCGPAAFFRIWVEIEPTAFLEFAVKLFEAGEANIGSKLVKANSSLLTTPYSKVTGFGNQSIPVAEWMIMSALVGTPVDPATGKILEDDGTTTSQVSSYLAATNLYRSVDDADEWGASDMDTVNELLRREGKRTDIIATVDSELIQAMNLSLWPGTNHFILLTSGFYQNAGDDDFDYFDYWCWGQEFMNQSVNYGQFVWHVGDIIYAKRKDAYWYQMPGLATQLAAGANNALYALGTGTTSGGFSIFSWDGYQWQQMNGAATRIAVKPDGHPVVVNSNGDLLEWNGSAWTAMPPPVTAHLPNPGKAVDVMCGADKSLFSVWNNEAYPSNGTTLWKWSGTDWLPQGIPGTRFTSDASGNIWALDGEHNIWKSNGLNPYGAYQWERVSGQAKDIAAGGDGSVWIIGMGSTSGGSNVYKRSGASWTKLDGGGSSLAAGDSGIPYLVNNANKIYIRRPVFPSTSV